MMAIVLRSFTSLVLPVLMASVGVRALNPFVWPDQWSAVQEISIVSGKYANALQRGRIAYDFLNRRTREDQVLISGPNVTSPETSNNMTEWFNGTHWFYMDWETGECQTADFGIGMVTPDWLIKESSFPRNNGSTYIHAFVPVNSSNISVTSSGIPPRSSFVRKFVNTTWIWVDGSAGFGEKPRNSVFEWYVDHERRGKRLHMPSTLSADLIVDLQGFATRVEEEWFRIPDACLGNASAKFSGTISSLSLRKRI